MYKIMQRLTIFFPTMILLAACGEGDADKMQPTTEKKAPAATMEGTMAGEVQKSDSPSMEKSMEPPAPAKVLEDNGVIYQEEIYKDWPYTEAPMESTTEGAMQEAGEAVEQMVASAGATATDKPYQLVDGNISQNAIEGWKTFNGGGCGACHGKGAIGAVGPNLGDSVTKKLSKEDFVNIVANGKPGTMMRPHKTNKRVMDNLDNLYAYLVARGDGVLGPGNLIKFPMGKQ